MSKPEPVWEDVKDDNQWLKGRTRFIIVVGILVLLIASAMATFASPSFKQAAVSTTQQELTYKIVPVLPIERAQGEGKIHFDGLDMTITVVLHSTPASSTCQTPSSDHCTLTISLLIEGPTGSQIFPIGTATSGQGGEVNFHGNAVFPSTGTFEVGIRLYLNGELAFTSDPLLQTIVLL